jgi:hypothetical protein
LLKFLLLCPLPHGFQNTPADAFPFPPGFAHEGSSSLGGLQLTAVEGHSIFRNRTLEALFIRAATEMAVMAFNKILRDGTLNREKTILVL